MSNIGKPLFCFVLVFFTLAAFSQKKADSSGWEKNDFTQAWEDYQWTFPTSNLKAGENSIVFTYTSGAHKLCLKDVVIKADGRTILSDRTEQSAGYNPRSAVYKFKLTSVPQVITLTAKARTSGGRDSYGYISFGDRVIDDVLYLGYGQRSVPVEKYMNNENIKEICFPETIEKIGDRAFCNCKGLKKLVIPGTVKVIGVAAFSSCSNLEDLVIEEGVEKTSTYSFYNCAKLNSVTLPNSVTPHGEDGLFWMNQASRVFHCFAGSEAYKMAVKKSFKKIDIMGITEKAADSITELNFSGNKVIKPLDVDCPKLESIKLGLGVERISAGAFRNYPVARIDLNKDLLEIGQNAFHDETILRVKKGSVGDKWARSNGYYLCGVLADINYYTKDSSKEITEDFTRILCDDDSYVNWTSYKFNTRQPLKLEEVDNKLVVTSFLLYPCKNVTVYGPDGKKLISRKTIQPLTRTILCDFDFMTDKVENYSITTDDSFYKMLTDIPVSWNISFYGWYYRPANMKPVHCRLWIAGIYNVAYTIGSAEYERRCYQAVEDKLLVTNEELTEFLTEEQMEKLLVKARNNTFMLCKCDDGFGISGGVPIYLENNWIVGLSTGIPNGFWHEFSHSMGWAHENGNMCFLGRPEPYEEDWPTIGSKLYQEEFKKGTLPYNEGETFLNPWFFSPEHMNDADPEKDVTRNGVLYIGEGMPCLESHRNQTDFTELVFSSSVEIIKEAALSGTALKKITIPSSVTKIEKSSFSSCLDLEEVIIPDTVKSLGDGAFQNCKKLSTVKIGSGLRQLNYRVFKGSDLREITIPANVKIIGKEAFQDNINLTKVVIEEGVKKIDNNAFKNTALVELAIPASVTEIGQSITSKNVVWVVEEGTYAYEFAMENKFKIK